MRAWKGEGLSQLPGEEEISLSLFPSQGAPGNVHTEYAGCITSQAGALEMMSV